MGASDIINAGRQLFARINTVKAENGQAEKLDANEIAQAKAFGFSLFNLTNDMTEEEFVVQYSGVKFNNQAEEDAFEQQERNIHVKFIQLKYGVKTEIQDNETIEEFEERAKDEGLNKAIEEQINQIKPDFSLDKKPQKNTTEEEIKYIEKGSDPKEEYVEPDPTMCRDSKTHDW